ncbi:MAG: DUF3887 domain-containing protein [Ruminococcaceae bacterium]|nr:DUF3887 domain-containing protein [Oscillospiraceae bacterium]
MKMKRVLSLGCLILAMSLLLTGCTGPAPLPEGMDKETVIAEGQEVMDELLAGEYELVLARFREDIRSQKDKEITVDVIKQLVDEHIVPEELGKFVEVGNAQAEGVTEPEAEPHGVAVFHCKYEKEKVAFGFAFDVDMNLIGLSIARQ